MAGVGLRGPVAGVGIPQKAVPSQAAAPVCAGRRLALSEGLSAPERRAPCLSLLHPALISSFISSLTCPRLQLPFHPPFFLSLPFTHSVFVVAPPILAALGCGAPQPVVL